MAGITMAPTLAMVTDSQTSIDKNVSTEFLRSKGLFKTLSLTSAFREGVSILPTALFLHPNYEALETIGTYWKWPLMIRVDYSQMPKDKPIGGLPIYSCATAKKVCDFLFSINCCPLFHKHADRFEDEYSVGVLIDPKKHSVYVEIVGRGFDAGDLRLGKSNPHEVLSYDIIEGSWKREFIINKESYYREVKRRRKYASKLKAYEHFINTQNSMLASIEDKSFQNESLNYNLSTLDAYVPLNQRLKKSLFSKIEKVYFQVLNQLPPSPSYVASFSYLPQHGWLLWDIYGHWYKR